MQRRPTVKLLGLGHAFYLLISAAPPILKIATGKRSRTLLLYQ